MDKIKPHLALLLCNSIWAMNYPLYHIVMGQGVISASAILSLSLIAAAIFCYIPLLWSPAERIDRGDIKYLVVAAILSGLFRKGLVIFGLSLTTPIEASIISSLLPVMALVISVVMGIDRFTTPRIVGVVLGMSGALAVIVTGNSSSAKATSEIGGDTLMLLYTVAAGFYMVWLQPIFKRYKPVTILRWVYTLSAIMFLPVALPDIVDINLSKLPPHILYMAIFVVVVPTFVPNLLLSYALRRVTPTISSIYSYIQPVVAIAVSVWLGVGRLHWSTLLFGLVIISGVALVIRSYSVHSSHHPHSPIEPRSSR